MGKNYNIYLGDEAVRKLEEKRKDKSFNLSSFVALALLKNNENKDDVPQLELLIKQKKTTIHQIETEIDALLYEIQKKIQSSDIEKERIRIENERSKYLQDVENYWKNLDDSTKEEYKKGVKDGKWKNTIEFYENKHSVMTPKDL